MKINIEYIGTIGAGTVTIEITSESTIKEVLTIFHQAIHVDDFYTIQGGAPPNRRAIKVSYEYFINNKRLRDKELSIPTLALKETDTIELRITKGKRVD